MVGEGTAEHKKVSLSIETLLRFPILPLQWSKQWSKCLQTNNKMHAMSKSEVFSILYG